jgi:hypothetical protein
MRPEDYTFIMRLTGQQFATMQKAVDKLRRMGFSTECALMNYFTPRFRRPEQIKDDSLPADEQCMEEYKQLRHICCKKKKEFYNELTDLFVRNGWLK